MTASASCRPPSSLASTPLCPPAARRSPVATAGSTATTTHAHTCTHTFTHARAPPSRLRDPHAKPTPHTKKATAAQETHAATHRRTKKHDKRHVRSWHGAQEQPVISTRTNEVSDGELCPHVEPLHLSCYVPLQVKVRATGGNVQWLCLREARNATPLSGRGRTWLGTMPMQAATGGRGHGEHVHTYNTHKHTQELDTPLRAPPLLPMKTGCVVTAPPTAPSAAAALASVIARPLARSYGTGHCTANQNKGVAAVSDTPVLTCKAAVRN